MIPFCKLHSEIDDLMREAVNVEIANRAEKQIPTLSKRYGRPKRPAGIAPPTVKLEELEVPGDVVRRRLYDTLNAIDAMEYPRSHHQRRFHECFICASLPSIYGDDYKLCEARLCREHKRTQIKTEVMIVTPRRFGKTFSVAQYVAAYSAAVHGKEVAIFSTGRRASKKMLDLIMRFLKPLIAGDPESALPFPPANNPHAFRSAGKKRILTQNVEEVVLIDVETGARNKICSYPAKVQVRARHFGLQRAAGRRV